MGAEHQELADPFRFSQGIEDRIYPPGLNWNGLVYSSLSVGDGQQGGVQEKQDTIFHSAVFIRAKLQKSWRNALFLAIWQAANSIF
jgi:hypothetical protein